MTQGKIISLMVGATIAGLSLASHASAQATTVQLWLHEHPPRHVIDEEIIAAFEAQNPEVDVQLTLMNHTDMGTRLLTGLATGSGPDLFNFLSTDIGQYYASGFLAPLDVAAAGFGSAQELDQQFLQGSLAGITFDGVPYGLPTEVSDYYCYANRALWKEAGLDPAVDYPKTWEELIDIAEKLTVRDGAGNPTRRGFDFNWNGNFFMWTQFEPMVRQLGATMVGEDYTAHLNTPEVAKVYQYWADWANKYRLGGSQYPYSREAFYAGEIATDCSIGIWGVPLMAQNKIDFSVFPVPRWSDAKSDNGFGNYAYYLMVNKRSTPEVQAAAWKFARFYTTYQAKLFTDAGLFVPAPETIALDAAKSTAGMDVYLSEFSKSFFPARIAGFAAVGDAFVRARDRIVQGNEEIAPVLESLQAEVDGILASEKAAAEARQ
ncbi:extracellular solute-binding protein [Mesorhizobium muleiense]|uniref:extracellular solute-binding protein n=1 Tax=Mesorhizobium muleiense TaxID=1004279 RepID=UPI001F1DC196|nr:extracellular solute-binding protein [Mesorhizobium muleiense]MCF6108427.1 extracellular solute-binding protein [Mesorhizobium muleiense]